VLVLVLPSSDLRDSEYENENEYEHQMGRS